MEARQFPEARREHVLSITDSALGYMSLEDMLPSCWGGSERRSSRYRWKGRWR